LALAGVLTTAQGAAALTACEATKPTIDRTALTEISLSGVRLEAEINPQGSETTYELSIVWRVLHPHPGEPGEPLPGGPVTKGGVLPAGNSDVTVSALLTGLQLGYTYWYEVTASNVAGKTRSPAQPFSYFYTGGYPEGTGAGPPSNNEESPCAIEGVRRSGEEAPAREAERQAQQREAEESSAKEARERAAKEHEIREAGERASKEAAERMGSSHLVKCVVPHLTGDSLSEARRALRRAHCSLGEVTRPRGHRRRLVVAAQSPRSGRKLRSGAKVAVTLRPQRRLKG
jgi:hypothetical protein